MVFFCINISISWTTTTDKVLHVNLHFFYSMLHFYDETELRAFFFVAINLPTFPIFSPSKKKTNRIKREKAVMATKKCTEFRFIHFYFMQGINIFNFKVQFLIEFSQNQKYVVYAFTGQSLLTKSHY